MSEGIKPQAADASQRQSVDTIVLLAICGITVGFIFGLITRPLIPANNFQSSGTYESLFALGVGIVAVVIGWVLARAGYFLVVRNPQDFYGGLVLVGMALFALWAASDLSGMHGFTFGPGTAPRMFAVLLGVVGAAVAAIGLFTKGPAMERYAFRGPLFITAGALVFAVAVRPLGLVIASYVSMMVTVAASDEARWLESAIWAAILTVFCALLFPYGLNLPLQLWPNY